MKTTCCCLLVLLILLVGRTDAVTLKESPVQNAMRASLLRSQSGITPGARFQLSEFEDRGQDTYESPSDGNKSTFKAVLYSALIPGGGQYYLGNRRTARYFFAAEALTWIGYFSFRTYGGWKKDDYINYAAIYADAQLEGKSDEFIDWVGFYENIREFNTLGRVSDPDRAYLFDTPENHWEWETPEIRQGFRDLRNRSREAYRRSDFMIGVAIIDRVISIVDAVRGVSKANRRIGDREFGTTEPRSFKFSVNPFSTRRQVSLTLLTGL